MLCWVAMDLLGSLGNGGLREAFSVAASSFFQPSKAREPTKRMRFQLRCFSQDLQYSLGLFAAGSDIHMNHFVSSAGNFLEQIQARRQTLRGQFKSSSISRPRTYGKDLHGYNAFKLLGSWQFCMGCLGSLSLWFEGLGRSPRDYHGGNKITMAFFGNSSGENSSKRRFWTNVLIGLNVLMFVAQEASHGKLLMLGAKVNSLIDQGQVWRLLTPAFLHASLPHLLTNCYSLNSIGPVIEAQGGSGRFLAVYFGSAITGFLMSYSFTSAPAVGASGAVFGLVGSLAVFLLRHKDLLGGANQSLSNLARMIAINLVLGLATSKIDNWGHLGGLVGGAVISWIVGPAFSYKRVPGERKMVLVDQPPLSYLFPKARRNEP